MNVTIPVIKKQSHWAKLQVFLKKMNLKLSKKYNCLWSVNTSIKLRLRSFEWAVLLYCFYFFERDGDLMNRFPTVFKTEAGLEHLTAGWPRVSCIAPPCRSGVEPVFRKPDVILFRSYTSPEFHAKRAHKLSDASKKLYIVHHVMATPWRID